MSLVFRDLLICFPDKLHQTFSTLFLINFIPSLISSVTCDVISKVMSGDKCVSWYISACNLRVARIVFFW